MKCLRGLLQGTWQVTSGTCLDLLTSAATEDLPLTFPMCLSCATCLQAELFLFPCCNSSANFSAVEMAEKLNDESVPFLDDEASDIEHTRNVPWFRKDESSAYYSTWRSVSPLISVFGFTTFIWVAILLFTIRSIQSPAKSQSQDSATSPVHHDGFLDSEIDFLTCGHNVEEAKMKGCRYDILTNHWLPEQCIDDFSVQEYQSDGSWFPFADENRTVPLAMDELGDLPYYFTSMRDHIVHCAMLWRRQFRALSEGWKYVDEITADAKHTKHCAQFLMDKAELQVYRTQPIKVIVGKSGCHVRGG